MLVCHHCGNHVVTFVWLFRHHMFIMLQLETRVSITASTVGCAAVRPCW